MGTSVSFVTSKDRPDPIKYSQNHLNRVPDWEVLASNKEYVHKDYGFYTYAVYSAVKTEKGVFGAVHLIGIKKPDVMIDYYEVSEKLMGEDEGPQYFGASKKVLGLLDSTDSKWANEWRENSYK